MERGESRYGGRVWSPAPAPAAAGGPAEERGGGGGTSGGGDRPLHSPSSRVPVRFPNKCRGRGVSRTWWLGIRWASTPPRTRRGAWGSRTRWGWWLRGIG